MPRLRPSRALSQVWNGGDEFVYEELAPRLRRIDGYREYVAPQRRKLDDVLRKNRAGPRAIGALEDVEKALDGLGDAVHKNYEELTK